MSHEVAEPARPTSPERTGPRLSVLDTVPIWHGTPPAQALRNVLTVASAVEELGYHRYWFAEHHNIPGYGTSTPPVLIARIADATSRLRVGSGGVMLPNHAPLVVAEQFATLEAFHPGRIDLGIGRAPGTDPVTAYALRRPLEPGGANDFPTQLAEVIEYLTPRAPGEPRPAIEVSPAPENRPPIWLLGSSPNSAKLAGGMGLPFAYAHHFSPTGTAEALAVYRETFQPSVHLDRPYSIVAANVIIADTDERAHWLSSSLRLAHIEGRANLAILLRHPEEAARVELTPEEKAFVDSQMGPQLIGGRDTVARDLAAFLAETGADELMAVTLVHDLDERVHSYRLLADIAASVRPAGPPAVGTPSPCPGGSAHPDPTAVATASP
ncbi:MAG: LLM class flavin-dependent oxidoreductase [Streptomycetaceae bacterium]|nr:LLM class flavin-dependent oxidoreductase [Streptomycetaceae bacterium]